MEYSDFEGGDASYGGAEVRNTPEAGCCGKVFGAMVLCLLGWVLFPLSLFGLGWNEKRNVCTNNAILFAGSNAQTVSCDSSAPSGTVAFISCPLNNVPPFTMDSINTNMARSDFSDALKFSTAVLQQKAEMYSCIQSSSQQTVGSGSNKQTVTTYSYQMGWSPYYVDASSFATSQQAVNARSMQCSGFNMQVAPPRWPANIAPGVQSQFQPFVLAGTYKIPNELMREGLSADQPVNLAPFAANLASASTLINQPPRGADWSLTRMNVAVSPDTRYLISCSVPSYGCMRLSFHQSSATGIAAFASIGPAGEAEAIQVPSFWGCAATTWEALVGNYEQKLMSLSDLQASLVASNGTTTWVLRLCGLLLAWAAIYMCLSPITTAADIVGDVLAYIPCGVGGWLESLLEGAVQCVVCLISCSTGISCGLFVISIVWVVMRPLVGGILMAFSILAFGISWYCLHQRRDQQKVVKGRLVEPVSDVEEVYYEEG